MRAILIIACAALALSGCGKKDQNDNNLSADENLTAENIVSNDITAIDAATGDAANMAADVDMNFGGIEDNGAATVSAPAKPTRTVPKTVAPAATETAQNSVANNTTNAE